MGLRAVAARRHGARRRWSIPPSFVGYFFAVLHFLANWLNNLEKTHIHIYAVVAIVLIIGQAILLETVTTALMRLLQGGRSE